ncbi:PEP-CTERM sorting domain-containing protein [Roseibacillus ishigakijimensis]|uniref:PEP-CTERM sorting domain-containing protein n=1 Tax=Roseibacillus ishigakijimensis TaxID=454146 RepID=A0A934RRD8_9BACT|nr:PEP-CTERM sorting domain-containing protein [Roseibacillus ishigakijimensis]MBK1833649.1 PEP-CTERM sorting domain-containing protein [Roseibacillus ishigakijimensis]
MKQQFMKKGGFSSLRLFTAASLAMGAAVTSEAALVTIAGPSLVSNDTTTSSTGLDIDNDGNNEFIATFVGQGSLILFGEGDSAVVGALNGGSFEATAYGLNSNFTIGSGLTYGGVEPGFSNLAEEASTPTIGDWAGGNDAYFGLSFVVGGETYYGYARLNYIPDIGGGISSANFIELTYEDVAGDPAVHIPEPSAALLACSALFGLALRRRQR